MSTLRHSRFAGQLATAIRESEKFHDIFIYTPGYPAPIPAHLSVLVSASPFIQKIISELSGHLIRDISIVVGGISHDMLIKTIRYIYGDEVIVKEKESEDFESCLDLFQVSTVKASHNVCSVCQKVVNLDVMIGHLYQHESELKSSYVAVLKSSKNQNDQICCICSQVLIGADSAEQKQWFRKHVKNCSLRIKNFREALLSRNKPVLQANPRQPDSLVKPKCSKCKKEFMTKFQLAKHSEKCRLSLTHPGNSQCLACGLHLTTESDSSHVCCTCPICSNPYPNELDLKKHLCSVHFAVTLEKIASIGSYPFPCLQEKCDFLCLDLISFTDHFGVFHERLFDALRASGMDELMAKFYPKKYANFCISERLKVSKREFRSSSLNTSRQVPIPETNGLTSRDISGINISTSLPASRRNSTSERETLSRDVIIQSSRSGLEIEESEEGVWSNRNSPRHTSASSLENERSLVSVSKNNKATSRSIVAEIRCNECHESFSTRAIKHLHTCNSILDKQTMAVSGDFRKTKQTTYFDNDEHAGPREEISSRNRNLSQESNRSRNHSKESNPVQNISQNSSPRQNLSQNSSPKWSLGQSSSFEKSHVPLKKSQISKSFESSSMNNFERTEDGADHVQTLDRADLTKGLGDDLVKSVEDESTDYKNQIAALSSESDSDEEYEDNSVRNFQIRVETHPEPYRQSYRPTESLLIQSCDQSAKAGTISSDLVAKTSKVPTQNMENVAQHAHIADDTPTQPKYRPVSVSTCSSTGSVSSSGSRKKPMPKSALLKRLQSSAGTNPAPDVQLDNNIPDLPFSAPSNAEIFGPEVEVCKPELKNKMGPKSPRKMGPLSASQRVTCSSSSKLSEALVATSTTTPADASSTSTLNTSKPTTNSTSTSSTTITPERANKSTGPTTIKLTTVPKINKASEKGQLWSVNFSSSEDEEEDLTKKRKADNGYDENVGESKKARLENTDKTKIATSSSGEFDSLSGNGPNQREKVRQTESVRDRSESDSDSSSDSSSTSTAPRISQNFELDDDDNLICDQCSKKFENSQTLSEHLVQEHPDD